MSKAVVVRYQTKSESADENQQLVEKVFAQLSEDTPTGMSYTAFRLADGVSFVHILTTEGDENPLVKTTAFANFQQGIPERVVGPPDANDATVIGAYRSPTS